MFLIYICSLISDIFTRAQAPSKRNSRITSSRTSFGTQVRPSASGNGGGGTGFECPEEFGYYPHPTDCTQYYVCVFGGALLESCTGGLMYSHELQTCDWPRNVGCEVGETRQVVATATVEEAPRTNQQQVNVPSRIRFGSLFSGPGQTSGTAEVQPSGHALKPTVPPQYHRQPSQVIQAQVQTLAGDLPPLPELKVPPNPVITSRGQPKHILEAQEEIAKVSFIEQTANRKRDLI